MHTDASVGVLVLLRDWHCSALAIVDWNNKRITAFINNPIPPFIAISIGGGADRAAVTKWGGENNRRRCNPIRALFHCGGLWAGGVILFICSLVDQK